ncbi:unnamed protein product [Adineta steineri]|uniref:Acyltransferase 3 domain-containing protein n=1 Tax=Adineta steineri TaxID=433720 RepID=A0A819QY45_9BILA|nr:unnamed protein product [Adineta steineri]CAF4036823.1 unnamed protein product [Adineta steineri]
MWQLKKDIESLFQSEKYAPINGMRSISCLTIVSLHIGCLLNLFIPPYPHIQWMTYLNSYTYRFLSLSMLSLETFFMLSGFLLTLKFIQHQDSFSWKEYPSYIVRRACRFWPGILLITIIMLILGESQGTWTSFWLFYQNYISMNQWLCGSGALWSVSLDMQMHIILPIILSIVINSKSNYQRTYLALYILVILSIVYSMLVFNPNTMNLLVHLYHNNILGLLMPQRCVDWVTVEYNVTLGFEKVIEPSPIKSFMELIYLAIPGRYSSFIIGSILAFNLINAKNNTMIRYGTIKKYTYLTFIFLFMVLLTIPFEPDTINPVVSTIMISIIRQIFAISQAFILFSAICPSTHPYYSPWIRSFLSQSIWTPIAKLSYLIYRGISTPPFNFFFGHFKTLWNAPFYNRQLENWTKQYGKIYGIYQGTHPFLVVSDPDFLQEVFIKQFSIFHVRIITMLDNVSSNVALSNGSTWRRQRHVINPSFTAMKLRAMSPLINKSISDLVDKLFEHSNSGAEFNIYLYYKRLSMDIICRCAFGIDIDLQHNPNHIYLNKLEELFGSNTVLKSSIFRMTLLIPAIRNILSRLYLIHNTARKYINTRVLPLISSTKQLDESAFMWLLNRLHTIVEQRQETPISRKDLLQLMLQVMTKEPIQDTTEDDTKTNYWLSKDEVVGNTLIFMATGYETTSTALAYATYVLAKHPDVLKKLQDEIDQLPIDSDDNTSDEKIKEYLDYDTVTHLSYMDMFISEVLRMYPIGNLAIQRCAMENTVVQGINIEKGTAVYADIYSIHYDRELWGPDDPYIFLPERHKIKRHPMAFMAFGAGPRNCIGMRFALIEMKMLLTRLLREYTILPGEHLESNFNIHEEAAIVPEAIWIKLLKRET